MIDVITTFKTNPDLLAADEKSGSGMFSDVYLTPCGDYAIKHGNYGFADGWLLFAAKLLSMPEDERPWWAPVIHSLRVDMETGRFTALIRAYEEYADGPTAAGYIAELMQIIQDGLPDLGEDAEYPGDCWVLLEADEFGNSSVECVEFLHALEVETGIGLYFDMPGNSMWDNTTGCLVLNDPCCTESWQSAQSDFRYREQFIDFLVKCAETAPCLQLVGDW